MGGLPGMRCDAPPSALVMALCTAARPVLLCGPCSSVYPGAIRAAPLCTLVHAGPSPRHDGAAPSAL